MINAIIKGIFNLIISLVNTILLPIDTLISNYIPGFSDILDFFGDFITYILSFIPWILSWFNIPSFLITFVVAYYVFRVTVTLAIHTVKLALKWYDILKL